MKILDKLSSADLEKQADEILARAGFKPDLTDEGTISLDELGEQGIRPPDKKVLGPEQTAEEKFKQQIYFGANVFAIAECQKTLNEFRQMLHGQHGFDGHPRRAVFQKMFTKPVQFVHLWQVLFSCGTLKFLSIVIQNPVFFGLMTDKEARNLEYAIVFKGLLSKGEFKKEIAAVDDFFPGMKNKKSRELKITKLIDDYDRAFKKFNSIFPMEFSEGDILNEAIYPLTEAISFKALKGKYDNMVMKDLIKTGEEARKRAQQAVEEEDRKSRKKLLKKT
jgi:hypothetical protein